MKKIITISVYVLLVICFTGEVNAKTWVRTNHNNSSDIEVNTELNSTPANLIIASSSVICIGDIANLTVEGGSLEIGDNWYWYSETCGGTIQGIGSSISVSPNLTTIYYVRAEGDYNTTTCVSKTITVNTPSIMPISAFTSSSTICNGSSTTLNITGGSLGIGANWHWYLSSCGINGLDTGEHLIVNPTISTTYYVRAEGTCNTTNCVNATLSINNLSIVPTFVNANPSTICDGLSTTLNFTNGSLGAYANWRWYSTSCGAGAVGIGASIIINPTITKTYYLRAEGLCNTTSCISTIVVVNNNSIIPTSAIASSSTICDDSSVSLNVSGGSLGTEANWNWFTESCGGTFISSGIPTLNPTETTTYYVRAEGICNTTSCLSTTVTVNAISTMPAYVSANLSTVCSGSAVTLSINGGNLGTNANWKWYSSSCGTTIVAKGAQVRVIPIITTTYYVRAEGICNTTNCANISLNVNTLSIIPSSISISSSVICVGTASTLNVIGGSLGTGANMKWYSGSCGGTLIGNGTTLVASPTITTTYYVRAEGTCNTTNCINSSVIVNTESIIPSSAVSNPSSISSGSSNLVINGGSLGTEATWNWYSGSCGGILIGNGTTLIVSPTITTTYYIRAEGLCNTTNCVNSTVNVNTIVTIPLSNCTKIMANPTAICYGSSSTLTVKNGNLGAVGNWYWYEGSCGGNSIGVGVFAIVSPTTTTTYYLRVEGPGYVTTCTNKKIIVKPHSIPPTTISANPSTICKGNSSTLSFVGGHLGTMANWKWYSGSCGGNGNGNGNGNCGGNGNGNCNGNNGNGNCGGNSGSIGAGTSIIVNPIITTLYYVRAEGECNSTSCTSITLTVTNSKGEDESVFIDENSLSTKNMVIYPNPANEVININYEINDYANVKITLYNVLGTKVMDIINESQIKGIYNAEVNLNNIPNGLYIIKLNLDDNTSKERKFVITK